MTTTTTTTAGVAVKTVPGKSFSVERYYMLSEIEQLAVLPVYLDDHSYDEEEEEPGDVETVASAGTAKTVASRGSSSSIAVEGVELPDFPVLYLLWDRGGVGESASSSSAAEEEAELFRKGPLEKALRKLRILASRAASSSTGEDGEAPPRSVYVVVDVQLRAEAEEEDDDAEREKEQDDGGADRMSLRRENFEKHQRVVEALARTILLPLEGDEATGGGGGRIRLVGATLGLADHARAAPGLETCLEAIQTGARTRRIFAAMQKKKNEEDGAEAVFVSEKSSVGIVCHSLADLVGFDEETETDAVQGVMQSLTHASREEDDHEEAGPATAADASSYRPPIRRYARDAHRSWRVRVAGLPPEPTPKELAAEAEWAGGGGGEVAIWPLLALLAVFVGRAAAVVPVIAEILDELGPTRILPFPEHRDRRQRALLAALAVAAAWSRLRGG